MSLETVENSAPHPTSPPSTGERGQTHTSRSAHIASAFLLLATVFWGCGFVWAKSGGDAVNRLSGAGSRSPLGPMLLLAWRFVGGGLLCLLAFPGARRGWNRGEFARAGAVGFLLGAGLITQHLGLDRTSEAVAAFLTSLTILFVPLIMTIGLRRSPPLVEWLGVFLAAIGIWLMTGGAGSGFGLGEWLGLACSIGFSFYILSVNAFVTRENVWRMTAGQFIIAGLLSALVCATSATGRAALAPTVQWSILTNFDVWPAALALTLMPTVIAFGLMAYFQPRLDPTHAALIYMMEPIVASVFAYVVVGHQLALLGWLGAGLIIAANVVVELIPSKEETAHQAGSE